jgi:hypothetical protein
LNDWLQGQYHEIPLDPEEAQRTAVSHLKMTRRDTAH